jgi:hypothetical protein
MPLPEHPYSPESFPAYFINSDDKYWLENLGCLWPEDNESEWIEDINALVAVGSTHIDYEPGNTDAIVSAREKFLVLLTKIDPAVLQNFRQFNPKFIPLDSFILSQRTINARGIDNERTVNSSWIVMALSAEAINRRIDNFQELGVNVTKVINNLPALLSYSPANIKAKVKTLSELGFDAPKIIDKAPTILTPTPATINARVKNLKSLGLNAGKIVNYHPAILSLAEETIRNKVANLCALNLNVIKVANGNPNVLSLATETVAAKLDNLTELGLDAIKVANGFPTILSMSIESIKTRINVLYAAARAGSVESYKEKVNALVAEAPSILGARPGRNRTLIRVLNGCLPPDSNLNGYHVNSIIMKRLEATLAGYLELGKDVETPEDLIKITRKYSRFSPQSLRAIIERSLYQDDPAVKIYKRTY